MRLVELDGKPQRKCSRVVRRADHGGARSEWQEQPVGAAKCKEGALVTSFGAYQPRTFAVKARRTAERNCRGAFGGRAAAI